MNTIERHLATCRDCRLLLAQLSRTVPEHLVSWAEDQAGIRKTRRNVIAVSSVLAAAASIAIAFIGFEAWHQTTAAHALIPPYAITHIGGGVALTRGSNQESDLFLPDSRIMIRLESEQNVPEAPIVRTYTSCNESRLSAASTEAIGDGEGGFHMEARARDLFGDAFGRCFVHFVLSPQERGTPPDLSGRALSEAQREARADQWVTASVRYVQSVEERE